jgi:hypothetical protein
MARKIVKVENHHSKIGMVMAALAAAGAFGILRNRRRRATLGRKLTIAAASLIAAREVLGTRRYARVRPSRLAGWLAR